MAERPKNCILCGAPITQPAHGVRKFCPACAMEKKKADDKKCHAAFLARKRKKTIPHYTNCTMCGVPFPPGTNPLQKYCRVCSLEVHRTQAREAARKKSAAAHKKLQGTHKRVNKICERCGKMMRQVDPGRKFCIECSNARHLERNAKIRAEKKALGIELVPPAVQEPKTSHEKIVSDNAAAIAKGMTYGQYKAWQRRQKELMDREETGSMA